MKQLLVIIAIVFCCDVYSQTTEKFAIQIEDTLYLQQDNPMSDVIYSIWTEDTPEWDGTNPYIKFVPFLPKREEPLVVIQ